VAYTLAPVVIEQEKIGTLYHLGLGTTTPGQASPDHLYGYMLVADQQLGRFLEKTDLHSKDQLTQYSSENLIDRDFVNTPRVTDGDFSGGALQQNFIDTHRFWDSDLDTRVPGYLQLRAGWARRQLLASGALTPQTVPYSDLGLNRDTITTFGGASIYNSAGTTFTPGITAKVLDTDGEFLYVADGVNGLVRSASLAPGGVWTTLSTTIGTIKQMWAVNLGTTGRFLYYTTDNRSLNVFDLNTSTQGIAVPLGGASMVIVDVVPYQARVAILTRDPTNQGFDVWYHDGLNLQHIIRVNQYIPSGMCALLGQLFITASATSLAEPPILARIGAGTFEIILRAGKPFASAGISGGISIGAPYAGDQYVYFALTFPQLNGISVQPYIGVYDVLSGTYAHLGNMDGTDAPQAVQPRQLAASGRAVVFPMVVAGVGYLQFQVNSGQLPIIANSTYVASGWMCTSRFDFNTPAIAKLMRRIIVHHSALPGGTSIQVNAYIDGDPMSFTTGLVPNPAGATVTNSTAGTTTTILTFPVRTIAHSLFFAMKLTSDGTFHANSPTIFYASVEVSVPWTWEGWLDLTHKRRMLDGDEDNQGCTVLDLYWLLHYAWENGQPMTVFHPNGTSYVAVIESLEFQAFNPVNISTPEHPPGIEWWCHVLLRDSLE
jgi:hypothetical protein